MFLPSDGRQTVSQVGVLHQSVFAFVGQPRNDLCAKKKKNYEQINRKHDRCPLLPNGRLHVGPANSRFACWARVRALRVNEVFPSTADTFRSFQKKKKKKHTRPQIVHDFILVRSTLNLDKVYRLNNTVLFILVIIYVIYFEIRRTPKYAIPSLSPSFLKGHVDCNILYTQAGVYNIFNKDSKHCDYSRDRNTIVQ